MTKRKYREGCCASWWDSLVDEIVGNGGYVHSGLTFCADSRQLMLVAKQVEEDGRKLQHLQEGTVLLRIPSNCWISKQRAMDMVPPLRFLEDEMIRSGQQLFSPLADVWIAMALSMITTAADANGNKDRNDPSRLSLPPTALPYLHTLPDPTTFQSLLPRQWHDNKIENLLQGSPLVDRIRAAKDGIANDYQVLQQAWNKESIKKTEDLPLAAAATTTFPSFSTYNSMLAAVSSRAFVVKGNNNFASFSQERDDTPFSSSSDVAMIPILDLCDHYRGQRSLKEKKNVTYQFQDDGSVEVKSTTTIETNDALRITYGALGNGQLLFNYGFAIPHNLEPDGSSNDFLEWKVDDSNNGRTKETIILRTGPKSYTYGGLVQAIEHFLTGNRPDDDDDVKANCEGNDDDYDDMEAFLDECNDDSGEIDIYGEMNGEEEGGGEDDSTSLQEELASLQLFRKELKRRFYMYGVKGSALKDRLSDSDGSSEYYASLLVYSEQRTIYFFTRAIEKLQARLKNDPKSKTDEFDLCLESLEEEDSELIESQTNQLVDAYIKIRHSSAR